MLKTLRAPVLAALALMLPQLALAHAALVSSTPRPNQVLHGTTLRIDLHFNSRVDAQRCMLSLASADGAVNKLMIAPNSAADELISKAEGLHRGAYVLRWQALASDGHVTRGEIPFSVK